MLLPVSAIAAPPQEPTNAKEATEKKAAETRPWTRRSRNGRPLPPGTAGVGDRARENLGAFYLPLYKRDKVKGGRQRGTM